LKREVVDRVAILGHGDVGVNVPPTLQTTLHRFNGTKPEPNDCLDLRMMLDEVCNPAFAQRRICDVFNGFIIDSMKAMAEYLFHKLSNQVVIWHDPVDESLVMYLINSSSSIEVKE